MKFIYSDKAAEELAALSRENQRRIAKKMRFFEAQRNPLTFAEPLSGYRAFRFRIGNYRAIFEIEDDAAYIFAIRRRDKAYEGLE